MEVSVSPSIGNWLKYHAAAILPLAHAYGKAGRDVKALSRDGLNLALRAIREGFSVLKELGHGDAPESMRRLERLPVMLAVPFLRRELGKPELEYVFAKGESMDGELEVLDEEFRALIASTSVQTPAYDELRKQ
jgi:hypothetical protein